MRAQRRDQRVERDRRSRPTRIVISPGPGHARTRRASRSRLIRALRGRGRRSSASASGTRRSARPSAGEVVRAPRARCTARRREIHHDGQGVFAGLPDPFTATRYHSLVVDARDAARVPRGHRPGRPTGRSWACATASCPLEGVQFHPESILTTAGKDLLRQLPGDREPMPRAAPRQGASTRHRLTADEAGAAMARDHGRRGDGRADRRRCWSRCA